MQIPAFTPSPKSTPPVADVPTDAAATFLAMVESMVPIVGGQPVGLARAKAVVTGGAEDGATSAAQSRAKTQKEVAIPIPAGEEADPVTPEPVLAEGDTPTALPPSEPRVAEGPADSPATKPGDGMPRGDARGFRDPEPQARDPESVTNTGPDTGPDGGGPRLDHAAVAITASGQTFPPPPVPLVASVANPPEFGRSEAERPLFFGLATVSAAVKTVPPQIPQPTKDTRNGTDVRATMGAAAPNTRPATPELRQTLPDIGAADLRPPLPLSNAPPPHALPQFRTMPGAEGAVLPGIVPQADLEREDIAKGGSDPAQAERGIARAPVSPDLAAPSGNKPPPAPLVNRPVDPDGAIPTETPTGQKAVPLAAHLGVGTAPLPLFPLAMAGAAPLATAGTTPHPLPPLAKEAEPAARWGDPVPKTERATPARPAMPPANPPPPIAPVWVADADPEGRDPALREGVSPVVTPVVAAAPPAVLTVPNAQTVFSPMAQLTQAVHVAIETGADAPTTITLRPEELGPVRFEISQSGDRLHITLYVERADALELMRRHGDQLLTDLRQSGFAQASLAFGDWSQRDSHPDAPPPDDANTPALRDVSAAFVAPAPAASGRLDLRL